MIKRTVFELQRVLASPYSSSAIGPPENNNSSQIQWLYCQLMWTLWGSGLPRYHPGCHCPPHVRSKEYLDWRFRCCSGPNGSSFSDSLTMIPDWLFQFFSIMFFTHRFNPFYIETYPKPETITSPEPPNKKRVSKMNVWANTKLMGSFNMCTGTFKFCLHSTCFRNTTEAF